MRKTGLRLFSITSVYPSLVFLPLSSICQRTTNGSDLDRLSRFGRFSHWNLNDTLCFRLLAELPSASSRASSFITLEFDPTAFWA